MDLSRNLTDIFEDEFIRDKKKYWLRGLFTKMEYRHRVSR